MWISLSTGVRDGPILLLRGVSQFLLTVLMPYACQVLAVKKIDSSLFQGSAPQEFSDIVVNISKIRNANIAELVGYCSEHGHNMLIYEYFRNGSLHEFLHMSDDYSNPLTWNTRVRIALGTARAVE